MYYDRRQQRLNRFEEGTGDQSRQSIKSHSSQRKKLPKERSRKRTRLDVVGRQLDETRVTTFPETSVSSIDKDNQLAANSGEHSTPLQEIFDDDDRLVTLEKFGPNEEDEACSSVAASTMKPNRQRRFIWTDEADR